MGMVGGILGGLGGALGAAGKDKISNQAYDTSRVIDSGTRNAAINAGNHVLSALPQNFDTSQGFANQGASSLATAAHSPDIGGMQDYYRKIMSGSMLNGGPIMQNYWKSLRNQANTAAADQNARGRSQAAMVGANPGSSTWQQMQAANSAAANNNANNAVLSSQGQNYQFERGMQNQAPSGLLNALSAPGQLFGNAANLTLAPSLQAGQAMQANYLAPWTMGVENVMTKTPDTLKKLGGIFQGATTGAMGGMTGGMFGGPSAQPVGYNQLGGPGRY